MSGISLTIQQVLADAKALQSRLGEDESKLNGLVADAQTVYSTIESMREYQEDIDELNEEAHQRPRVQLIAGIQQENRHIRELQHENRELKAALEEHQNALDVIMSKYRQQVLKLLQVNKASKPVQGPSRDYSKIVDKCHQKMHEMVVVMKNAVNLDDASLPKQQELIARLMTENKTLRELLEISERNGTLPPGSRKKPPRKEKQTQTDSLDDRLPEEPEISAEPCPSCGHGRGSGAEGVGDADESSSCADAIEVEAPDGASSPIHNQPGLMDVSVASSSCDTDVSIDSSDTSVDSVIMSPKRVGNSVSTATTSVKPDTTSSSPLVEDAPSSVPAVVLT